MNNNPLTNEDQEFLEKIYEILKQFVESGEAMLEMEPMNSYQRRLVHKIATDFQLNSHSVGEEERFVCVAQSENPHIPEKQLCIPQQTHDWGNQTFFTAPNTRIILRSDGSFGIPLKSERYTLIDERMVENSFRIRNNKIICYGEAGW